MKEFIKKICRVITPSKSTLANYFIAFMVFQFQSISICFLVIAILITMATIILEKCGEIS